MTGISGYGYSSYGYAAYATGQSAQGQGVTAESGRQAMETNASGAGRAEDSSKVEKPKLNPGQSERVAPGRRSSPAECKTCKERRYQDGSDESNVSFKAAMHVSPSAAGARVRAHEQEHVSNAYKKAAKNNGKVVNASVAIHTAVCPECGRTYVSGGTTTTHIKYNNESNPYQQNKKANDAMGLVGQNVNLAG